MIIIQFLLLVLIKLIINHLFTIVVKLSNYYYFTIGLILGIISLGQ